MLQLTLVSGAIVMALGLGNQTVLSDSPYLEAADANRVSSSPRRRVGAGQCPAIDNIVALLGNAVQKDGVNLETQS
jgi:hypothetical protein